MHLGPAVHMASNVRQIQSFVRRHRNPRAKTGASWMTILWRVNGEARGERTRDTRRPAEKRSMQVHTFWERALLRAQFLNHDDESECL
jgi:hypothetical protein